MRRRAACASIPGVPGPEAGPDRRSLLAALLLGAGLAATVIIGRAYLTAPETHAQGSGDPGFVAVYAQLPAGPVRLEVGVPRRLPRPQDLAFQWSAEGTGPRLIRIELMAEAGSVLLTHEERVMAPMTLDSLGWVLHLGDEYPDQLELVVTISAPHTGPRILKYPFQLGAHSS